VPSGLLGSSIIMIKAASLKKITLTNRQWRAILSPIGDSEDGQPQPGRHLQRNGGVGPGGWGPGAPKDPVRERCDHQVPVTVRGPPRSFDYKRHATPGRRPNKIRLGAWPASCLF
jgi:hypothetical protein